MKKRKNVMYRKSVSLLAAAAMTAVLMTGQVYPVVAWGQNTETRIEKSSLIPDNITIDEPVALSEVTLPKSDYGTLSWVDDSYVPDKRVQSCEVVFKPAADVDLSYISGWDSEKKVVKGKITVVVSSIEEKSDEQAGDSGTEVKADGENSGETAASADNKETDLNKETDQKTEETAAKDDNSQKDPADSGENEEQIKDAGNQEDSEADKAEASESTDASDEVNAKDNSENTDETTIPSEEKSETATETPEENPGAKEIQKEQASAANSGNPADSQVNEASDDSESTASDNSGTVDSSEGTGKLNAAFGEAMPGATVLDGTEDSEKSENTEDNQKNIFDNPLDFSVTDSRPDTAEDNLTEEEQAERAAQNHSCEGISVSGIDLPWYVQFQVTSGENYEFKNEDKATIFQSYEFKLWDLKNNTEYQIPDGQYVSVTIPVKEGYEYSIEHLLDNGATETIIPSVNGTTMVFSTHSFSPFGIAGFRPIVGEDIANGAYGDGSTPTPTPTVTISTTPAPTVTGAGTNGTAGTDGTGTGSASGNNGNSANAGTDNSNGSSGTANGSSDGTVNGGSSSGNGSSNGSGNSGSSSTPGTADDGTGNAGTTAGNSSAGTGSASANAGQTAGNGAGSTAGSTVNNTNANNGQSQTSNAVKTGDNTMILPFVILVIVAAAVIIIVLVVRKKKNK